ncbi:hypothetical protein NL676_034869 [Syzygium grande]|nr:hypothetical protein NL676_034869 [Syzygium grande]
MVNNLQSASTKKGNEDVADSTRKARDEVEVEGNEEVEAVNPDYADWVRTDQLISSWISGAVSENILSLIIGLETSYELNAIGKPVDEITKMFGVLEGLGSEYENFRTTMYCLKPQPEYDEVISQLERFETRLQSYSSSQYNPHLAYYGQRKSEDQQKVESDREPVQQNFGFGGQRGEPYLGLHFYEAWFYRGKDGIDVGPLQGFEVPSCMNPGLVVPPSPDGVVINPPRYALVSQPLLPIPVMDAQVMEPAAAEENPEEDPKEDPEEDQDYN